MYNLPKNMKVLTLLTIVMITVGSVDSIRNLPTTALFGSSLVFFFLIGAIFFLIPCALIAAELSSTWSEAGGIYGWVRQAFGKRVALFAIWFQWIENVLWYPTILAFLAGTAGYLISPDLAHNKFFLIFVILASFWGVTLINWLGMKSSARFSNFCTFAGLLAPMTLIISFGFIWFLSGMPIQINLTPSSLLPDFNNTQLWVALAGIILSFCGMEIAAVHGCDVKNPQKTYPRAMLIATFIILLTLIFGSLAIAIVVPQNEISLVAGIMQACDTFFGAYHMQWVLPIIGVMLIIGGLGSVSNWTIAPTRGLLIAAEDNNLPAFLQKTNRFNAPSNLLLYQAIIVTFLSCIFLLMPSVNASYWLLTALAAQLYMFMYLLMFLSAIYLRYKYPNIKRPYAIPGKNYGIWIIGSMGMIGALTTIIVGFIPPTNIEMGSVTNYELLLISGLIIMSLPPLFATRLKRTVRVYAEEN
jgi:amino acid transporter